jgi:cell division septation protein DedD
MTDQELYAKIDASEDTSTETTTTETPDISEEKPVEQTTETSVENQTQPTETQTPATQEPVPPTPATVSMDDFNKAQYSFKRQLGKQKDRYENQINEWQKKYEALEKRLGSLENPEKPLMRDQFQTDDEYIQNLIDKGVEKRWQEREEKMREEYAKYEQQQREEYEHRKELDEGINKWYPSAEERQKFVDTVQNAFSEGLSDLLEQEQNVLNYLHQTENSSRILYEFATKPEVVEQIFSVKNPLMRLMAVRDLENKLIAEKSNPAPVQAPAPAPVQTSEQPTPAAPVNNLAKSVGKPGTQVDAEPDIFDNRDSLRAFIRSH